MQPDPTTARLRAAGASISRTSPSVQALLALAAECERATDGRGRRWPMSRCVQALAGPNLSASIAANCASAMLVVQAAISLRAETAAQGRVAA